MARVISSVEELREVVAPPTQFVADKAIDHIDDASRRFLEASPFFLLATSAADGTCDVSPRGDPPGSQHCAVTVSAAEIDAALERSAVADRY